MTIAKGSQSKNTLGFWMNGHYAVIVDKYGRNKIELRQTLHIENGLAENFFYMQYVQWRNDKRTNITNDQFEGTSFTVRNTKTARKKFSSIDYYMQGYNGTNLLSADHLTGNNNF